MRKALLFFVALTLLLASCSHTSPYKEEGWYSALGREGEVVVKAEKKAVSLLVDSLNKEEKDFISKADRVTLSLENGGIAGAIEGDYSALFYSTALSMVGEKEKGEGTKWYNIDTLSVGIPKSGIILFSDGDYKELYLRTIKEREEVIKKEEQALLQGDISLYSVDPTSLDIVGLGLPKTVTDKIKKIIMVINLNEGDMYLTGTIIMETEGDARAINVALKNSVIQDIKRRGEKLDTKTLIGIFSYSDNVEIIKEYKIPRQTMEKALDFITNKLGGLI